jgi:hypothetical protein
MKLSRREVPIDTLATRDFGHHHERCSTDLSASLLWRSGSARDFVISE